MFREYGQAIRDADGTTILRTSGIPSRACDSHGSIQTQVQLEKDIWRNANLFEAGGKLQMSFTKWVFCFRPHDDGGYEYVPRGNIPVPLDTESSELIKDMVRQYRERKRGK